MHNTDNILRTITFDDLCEWAGDTILSRGKGYIKHVGTVYRTEDGTLTAEVTGTEKYRTAVILHEHDDFDSSCSCPYSWDPCKHAVALILAAARQLKNNKEIPFLQEGDAIYQSLYGNTATIAAQHPTDTDTQQKIQLAQILADKSKDELCTILLDAATRYPALKQTIIQGHQLTSGAIDDLVTAIRQDIRAISAEPAWYDHWQDDGSLPDYSPIMQQLHALLEKGYPDEVLQLGEELWRDSSEQVEQSHDGGETAGAITQCMAVALKALPQTSLAPTEQLLWLIDKELQDEFSLLPDSKELLANPVYTQDHWREVAAELETRLTAKPNPTDYTESYQRELILNNLLEAFSRSAQQEKVIPVLEQEVKNCPNYNRLVDELLSVGKEEKARQWCIEGFHQTIENAPGIAHRLQDRLRQMAEAQRQFDLVAAYRAQDFFDRVSVKGYSALRESAERADCWPAVRSGILSYLESGLYPDEKNNTPANLKASDNTWPLPEPEVKERRTKNNTSYQRFPDFTTLLSIAILEQRYDDTVELYRAYKKTQYSDWTLHTDKLVAEALVNTHPQISLEIWREVVDRLISRVKPKAYQEAAQYLRLMRKAYEANKSIAQWFELINQLRTQHKAKRRLQEVLDNLSGNKIIDQG